MSVLGQIFTIFAICLAGEMIAAVLPFPFPGSVVSMLLLLGLLAVRALKPRQLQEETNFLLDNMALFFIPSCVGIIRYADVLFQNFWAIVLISLLTTPFVFFVTGHAVQLTMKLMKKGENRMLESILRTPMFGLSISIAAFFLGRWIQKKTGWVLANPLVIATGLIIGLLVLLDIPYETYAMGGDIIHMMLGPATAVLALGIYNQRRVLKEHFIPVLVGCTVGSATSVFTILGLCRLFHVDQVVTSSLLPKSCTTAIAVSVAESHGGLAAIAAAAVMITGVTGALCAPLFAKWFHITDPVAQGLATGACSHALGTTKAREMGELQGAMSSLAIGICGLISVILTLFV